MKPLLLFSFAAAAAVVAAQAPLYGVGAGSAGFVFARIDTSTGAATPLFNFTVTGSRVVQGLTYIPSTNRFLTVAHDAANVANSSFLVEIDPVAQSAAVVAHGIPMTYFEGIEYMPALGAVAVSYGPGGFFTGNIALLDPATYALQNANAATGLPDGDILFEDNTGALNVVDANNLPSNGFQRNRINNPAGPGTTLTGIGGNTFNPGGGEFDLAWKADESRLFYTRLNQLGQVNPATNALTTVGNYGIPYEMRGIAAVPEPGTLIALGAGLAVLSRRRARRR